MYVLSHQIRAHGPLLNIKVWVLGFSQMSRASEEEIS